MVFRQAVVICENQFFPIGNRTIKNSSLSLVGGSAEGLCHFQEKYLDSPEAHKRGDEVMKPFVYTCSHLSGCHMSMVCIIDEIGLGHLPTFLSVNEPLSRTLWHLLGKQHVFARRLFMQKPLGSSYTTNQAAYFPFSLKLAITSKSPCDFGY